MPMEHALARLYRVQLRTARYFDKNPALKTLLTLPGAPLIADGGSAPGATAPSTPGAAASAAIAAAVRSFTEPSEVYLPGRSLFDFVRRRYNAPLVIGEEGEEAALRSALDVGFNAQRALVYVADLAGRLGGAEEHVALPPVPGLEESATLTDAPALAPGCMLVEHPSVTRPGRSLIYVYDISRNVAELHGNEAWMVRGYVVNRPFPSSVAAVTGMQGLGTFGGLTLFHGGGDDDQRLAVLHPHGDLEGAVPVNQEAPDTLFVGGSVEAINAAIAAGAASPGDFKAVVGSVQLPLVGDGDGGLALEHGDRYAFVTGSAVRPLALAPPMFDTTGRFRDGHGLGAGDVVVGYNYARFWHQNASWGAATRLLGQGCDPGSADPSWGEVRAWARLHAGVTHLVAAALPLPYRPFDAHVQRVEEPGEDSEDHPQDRLDEMVNVLVEGVFEAGVTRKKLTSAFKALRGCAAGRPGITALATCGAATQLPVLPDHVLKLVAAAVRSSFGRDSQHHDRDDEDEDEEVEGGIRFHVSTGRGKARKASQSLAASAGREHPTDAFKAVVTALTPPPAAVGSSGHWFTHHLVTAAVSGLLLSFPDFPTRDGG